MRFIIKIIDRILFILALIAIMIFCLNNNQVIQVVLYPLPFEIESRLFIIVLVATFSGMLIGYTFASISLIKEKFKNYINGWKIKFLRKKVKKIDKKPVLNKDEIIDSE